MQYRQERLQASSRELGYNRRKVSAEAGLSANRASLTWGSSITLLECVNNFLQWTGSSIPQALNAVTSTPAAMLGLQGIKGSLEPGADADLVILSDEGEAGSSHLVLDEVWKFGQRV